MNNSYLGIDLGSHAISKMMPQCHSEVLQLYFVTVCYFHHHLRGNYGLKKYIYTVYFI